MSEMSSLSLMYRDIRREERLSLADEQRLTHAWFYDHDVDAAKRLVSGNIYAVAAIAREYRHFGLPEPDLIQEGTLGLMHAVKRFDPEKGCRLMTYASWWIHASIHEFILSSWSIVKMGTNKLQRQIFAGLGKAKQAIAAFEMRANDAAAQKLGVTGEKYQQIAQSFLQRDLSLDACNEDGEAWVSLLASEGDSPEDILMQKRDGSQQLQQLQSAMDQLSERDRYIVRQRHLLEEPVTLKDLADELGVSIERVRQLEVRAMKKIREQILA
ncbi:MAG: RNA polymerase factor sigma-32 [Zetaproteobacteria bacterium]|nr:RNA polymerase factor sigma-32 [Zetaproteobacteria bacterium]